ncbi:MAG: ADP-ribosyltransferase [Candidatus Caldarchaeum sp.]
MPAVFQEEKHPRFPKGHPRGGQFMEKPDVPDVEEDPSDVSPEEREILRDYQNSGYAQINYSLRRQKYINEHVERKIQILDRLFERVPERDLEVWRGDAFGLAKELLEKAGVDFHITAYDYQENPEKVRDLEDKLNRALRGKIFRDRGFVSTTDSEEVAKRDFLIFGLHEMRPYETMARGLARITGRAKAIRPAKYTQHREHERELIIQRGTAFRVKSVSIRALSSQDLYLFWELEIVKE